MLKIFLNVLVKGEPGGRYVMTMKAKKIGNASLPITEEFRKKLAEKLKELTNKRSTIAKMPMPEPMPTIPMPEPKLATMPTQEHTDTLANLMTETLPMLTLEPQISLSQKGFFEEPHLFSADACPPSVTNQIEAKKNDSLNPTEGDSEKKPH